MTERSFAPHGEAPEGEVSRNDSDAKRSSDDAKLAKREERNEGRRAKNETKLRAKEAKNEERRARRDERNAAREASRAQRTDQGVFSLADLPFAMQALFGVVALIAACAYVISAWQVFGFAQHVWRLPGELCFGAALVADLLSLAGLFSTYLLRVAKRAVQAYAWFVFLGMTGLSIAAAESYATWRFAPDWDKPNVDDDARVASGAIVVALALAVHLLIICRNHVSEHPVVKAPPPAKQPATPAKEQVKAPETPVATPEIAAATPVQRRPQPPAPARLRTQTARRGAPAEVKAEAVKRVIDGGESAIQVAQDLGQHPRNVQNWVKAARQEQAPATNGHATAEQLKVQVN